MTIRLLGTKIYSLLIIKDLCEFVFF